MKKNGLFALVLCGMVLMGNAISAGAAYESSEDIAIAVRPVNIGEGCFYDGAGEEKTIFVNQDSIKEGKTLHFGIYVEAETQQLDILELSFQTSSDKLTFNKDTFISPKTNYYGTPKTFVLPDGTEFSTTMKPFCLGSLGYNNSYSANCMFECGFDDTQVKVSMSAMMMPGTKHEFLGGQSDLFSFVDLDVDIAPDIERGIYRIDFAEQTEDSTPNVASLDIADHSSGEGSHFVDTIPTLKGCNICVARKGDIDGDGRVSADDASKVLIYAASIGSSGKASFTGDNSKSEENLCCFSADVTGDSKIDAIDAANILRYAAIAGVGGNPDWNQIVSHS